MALIAAAERGEITLIMSNALHAEITETLSREKFRRWVTLAEAESFVAAVALLAEWVDDRPAMEIPAVCSDPDDDYLIALCQDAEAAMLVSGDDGVQKVSYPNVHIYSPAKALNVLAYRHEWGEGYLPGTAEQSLLQADAEGSGALLAVWSAFCAILENADSRELAEYLFNFVVVPECVPRFLAQLDEVREAVKDRGLGTRPFYASPEVAYLKLPPDPGEHIYTFAEVALPEGTIFATLQRCLDLPNTPDLPADHWRVFAIGDALPLEQIPPRPAS